MEKTIWDAISKAIMNPRILITHILHLTNNIKDSKDVLEKEKVRLIVEKQKLQHKRNKIIEAYTDGVITREQLKMKMKEYEEKERKIEEKLKEIEDKFKQIIHRPILIRDMLNFCKIISQRLKIMNTQQRKNLLKLLIEKIILYSRERKALIKGHIPLNEKDITKFAGTMFMTSRNHEKYPKDYIKFELEVKI